METDVKSLIAAGYQARRERRLPEAKFAFTQAIHQLRDAVPPTAHLAEALRGLGQIERDLGEIAAALEHHQQAADVYRDLDAPQAVAHTVRHVADIERENGNLAAAARNYDEALLLYRSHPETNALDLANALRGYALLKGTTGHKEAAMAAWQEARVLYEQVAAETGLDMQPAYEEVASQIARLGTGGVTPHSTP